MSLEDQITLALSEMVQDGQIIETINENGDSIYTLATE